MKSSESTDDAEPLRSVLKEWRATAALPAGFQEQVWRRIERSEMPAARSLWLWEALKNSSTTLLRRPGLALSYVTILLIIGATAGWAQARHQTARVGDQLSVLYVRSVDPYLPGH